MRSVLWLVLILVFSISFSIVVTELIELEKPKEPLLDYHSLYLKKRKEKLELRQKLQETERNLVQLEIKIKAMDKKLKRVEQIVLDAKKVKQYVESPKEKQALLFNELYALEQLFSD